MSGAPFSKKEWERERRSFFGRGAGAGALLFFHLRLPTYASIRNYLFANLCICRAVSHVIFFEYDYSYFGVLCHFIPTVFVDKRRTKGIYFRTTVMSVLLLAMFTLC